SALLNIRSGRSDLVLAGGVDALSRASVLWNDSMVQWLAHWQQQKSLLGKIKALGKVRAQFLKPVIGLLVGLTDPVVGLSMGQTAENLAHQFNISRSDMDSYASRSHALAGRAQERGLFAEEITPLIDAHGKIYDHDDGVRSDSPPGHLAKLRPAFEPPWGNITAGNSSQITDGAAMLLLASERAIKEHKLKPLGKIIDSQWAALDPAIMGLGP